MIKLIGTNSYVAGALLTTILLFGCVHPKVTYISHPDPQLDDPENTKLKDDETGKIKFRLGGTRVVLGEKDPGDQKRSYTNIKDKKMIDIWDVSALLLPREDDTAVFAVVPQSQWLWMVDTKLSVSYFDNTRLIQKIGMEVEDNRIKVIQAIGSTVSTIAAAARLARPKEPDTKIEIQKIEIPVAIDIDPEQTDWKDLPGNPGWHYMLDKTDKEPDAVARESYFKNHSYQFFSIFSSTRTFPVSSCRQTYLILGREKDPAKAKIILPIQIADYMNIRTYEMPDKGSISVHTLCGADITTEKSEIASSYEVLAELVKLAKTIKEAQDAKAPSGN